MDHLWIINGSYGGCADKIVGTGEIFRKEKMTNEGIDYRKWNCRFSQNVHSQLWQQKESMQ